PTNPPMVHSPIPAVRTNPPVHPLPAPAVPATNPIVANIHPLPDIPKPLTNPAPPPKPTESPIPATAVREEFVIKPARELTTAPATAQATPLPAPAESNIAAPPS